MIIYQDTEFQDVPRAPFLPSSDELKSYALCIVIGCALAASLIAWWSA